MSDSLALLESVKQAATIRAAGADPSLLDLEARWVVSEFLSETRVWRQTFSIVLTGGTSDYPLPIQDEQSVVVVLGARSDSPIEVGPLAPVQDSSETGAPRRVGMLNDRVLRVSPTPSPAESGLIIQVAVALTLLPTVDASPPDVIRPYHSYLLDGLLARIFSMPDKPWTNTRTSGAYLTRYNMGITRVRREVDGARTHGSLRMRGPRFA